MKTGSPWPASTLNLDIAPTVPAPGRSFNTNEHLGFQHLLSEEILSENCKAIFIQYIGKGQKDIISQEEFS